MICDWIDQTDIKLENMRNVHTRSMSDKINPECVKSLEYITHCFLFSQIWIIFSKSQEFDQNIEFGKISHNRREAFQEMMTSKVPTCDIREIMQIRHVSGQVLMNFMPIIFKINYCENIFSKPRWHVNRGTKRKLSTYLGTNGLDEKVSKNGWKGLMICQNEVLTSNRGYCCHGSKILRY